MNKKLVLGLALIAGSTAKELISLRKSKKAALKEAK